MLGLLAYLGAKDQRKQINRNSSASDPAELTLSHAKLKRLCPSMYFSSGVLGTLRCFFWNGLEARYWVGDMLVHGDSRAAVVVSTDPLRVACYCDDLDGVCLLAFPEWLVSEYGLTAGGRLLTVLNSASSSRPLKPNERARDLVQGDRANPRYLNFWPLVADFLSDDAGRIADRKAEIGDAEFERCRELGEEHLRRFGGLARDGRPDRSSRPAGEPWIRVTW